MAFGAGANALGANRIRLLAAVEIALALVTGTTADERRNLLTDAVLAPEAGAARLAGAAASAITDAGGGGAGARPVRIEAGTGTGADPLEAREIKAAPVS
jgi:hypothetical protein